MRAIVTNNGKPLRGQVCINGSKNATLPILAATLLTHETVILHNVPRIEDVLVLCELLRELGSDIIFQENPNYHGNHTLIVNTSKVNKSKVSNSSSKLRGSILLLGSLIGRFGKCKTSLPGGCSIGERSINWHIDSLQSLGVKFFICRNFIEAHGPLHKEETSIQLEYPSVGATENIILASVLREGALTRIENAAMEPDVVDLTEFLIKLGANITGLGTNELVIRGVENLGGGEYFITPDRIEAGTFAIAALLTRGCLQLYGIKKSDLHYIKKPFKELGGEILDRNDHILIKCKNRNRKKRFEHVLSDKHPIVIKTSVFPGFPTDLQQCFCTALAMIQFGPGSPTSERDHSRTFSIVEETVFEKRLHSHCLELTKLGAHISFASSTKAIIYHSKQNEIENEDSTRMERIVEAFDLRGAASLILAGLIARGSTIIKNIQHLNRGYEKFHLKLNEAGASIKIVKDD